MLQYSENEKSVSVSWSLHDLPTAQHKAGLAGLYAYVKAIPSLLPDAKDKPTIESESATSISIRFTEKSLATLMDSVYCGELHQVSSRSKWKDTNPVKVEYDEKGKVYYYYDIARPKAEILVYWRNGQSEDPWVKLWRDAVRGVLRYGLAGKIYKWTAEKPSKSPTSESGDLKDLWKNLKAPANKQKSVPVPSSMFIGTEAESAERCKFTGEVHKNLLLHFWPFVSMVFVPQIVEAQERKPSKNEFVLAVPEVSDLQEFGNVIVNHWRRQSSDSNSSGRPKSCLIDIPIEGGMAFLFSLAREKLPNLDDGDFFDTVSHVELYHLKKQGNKVRFLDTASVRFTAGMLREYDTICRNSAHFLLKRLWIYNIVDELPWYSRATDKLFSRIPWREFFIESDKTPSFGKSVHEQFTGEGNMNDRIDIAKKIYDIVGEFVARSAEKRGKTKGEVAANAFVEIRGRNGAEFVNYFIGSICRVPQFFGERGVSPIEGFLTVSQALHESEESKSEIKNLTLLALCAHSWQRKPKKESNDDKTQSTGGKQ